MNTITEPDPTELHATIKLGIDARRYCRNFPFSYIGSQPAEGLGSVGAKPVRLGFRVQVLHRD